MSKLYIDITELIGWQGKLTGVPRVMDEICQRFSQQGSIIFLSWLPSGYTVVNYPRSPMAHPGRKAKKISTVRRAAEKINRDSKLTRKLVSFAKSVNSTTGQIKKPSPFIVPGDKLFVLADWHGGDPSFIKYLTDAHKAGVKIAQIVYDMLPLVTPQYSGHSTEMLRNYSTKVYPICNVLFSISENTKKDISLWLLSNSLTTPPISVFRLGDDFSRFRSVAPELEIGMIIPNEFVLCVGTIEARKNHTLLYYTYKLAVQKGIKLPPLVIVGRLGYLAEDTYNIMQLDPEVSQKFIFLHDADDNQLTWLYENCLFSVYPSFYEGWGLPIAESIAHGKPVIASNTSSMPEIAGDLIQYFSPSSPDECLVLMTELLNKQKRQKAVELIKAYIPHSWDDSYATIKHGIGKI